MDDFRYALALVLWLTFFPLLGFWLLVHPLVRFWRRLGTRVSYALLAALVLAAMAALYAVREPVLAVEFGTRPPLVVAGLALLALAAAARVRIERELTTRALSGLRELDPDQGGRRLVTTGPYARLRHPRYVQVSVALLGWALLSNHLAPYLLFVLWLPLLHVIVILEERELRDRFGAEWEAYAHRVPRFWPRG